MKTWMWLGFVCALAGCDQRATVGNCSVSDAGRAHDDSGRVIDSPPDSPDNDCLRAFFTNNTYNGDLGGLDGADAKCQAAADDADLGGSWIAFLAPNGQQPSSRIRSDGRYCSLDHSEYVIANVSNLTLYQTPTTQFGRAATNQDALWLGSDSSNCSGWTSDVSDDSVYSAYFYGAYFELSSGPGCNATQSILCVETENN